MEKIFGERPASFLLTERPVGTATGHQLSPRRRALVGSSGGDVAISPRPTSPNMLDVEPATKAEAKALTTQNEKRALQKVTLQIVIPQRNMYKMLDFPADSTVADALQTMREKIPAIADEDAFKLTHVLDGSEVQLNTRQSMRIFSKTELNVVKLTSLAQPVDSRSSEVPLGPRSWSQPFGASSTTSPVRVSDNALSNEDKGSSAKRLMGGLLRSKRSQSSSNQPPPRLMVVLRDPELTKKFETYLRGRMADESYCCWRDIQDYKLMASDAARFPLAQAIFQRYLRVGAPDEVNVPGSLRRQVELRFDTADVDLFEQVETALVSLLRNDHYLGFLSAQGFELK